MQLKFLLLLLSLFNDFGRPLLLGQHSSWDDVSALCMVPVPGVGRQPGLQCTDALLLVLRSCRPCFSEVSGHMFDSLNK